MADARTRLLVLRSRVAATLACALLLPLVASARDLEPAAPESVGLSSERLARLTRVLEEEIAAERKAGFVVLIARQGKVAYHEAFGQARLAPPQPMRNDAYFRAYSMTKPLCSVALLMLFEEGHFQLNDPLALHVPALQDVQVYAGADEAGQPILEPPRRPITIQDVFRHTAGFTYGLLPGRPMRSPVEQMYADAGVSYGELESMRVLVEEKLPRLPLLFHPGERWEYSFAHDVQGYLVEHFSGMPLERFLRARLYEPLGMRDTFFGEPEADGPRCTAVYGPAEGGGLELLERPLDIPHERFAAHPFGGAGLTTTATDYARFAQMLLNGGELDGTRILGRKTVELMTADHLAPPAEIVFPGYGYGLGVAVCLSPAASGNLSSAGSFGWGGAATTWVVIDPAEELVALLLTQYMPYDYRMIRRFETLVYQAIVD